VFIRCTACKATTRTPIGHPPLRLACHGCGREHSLSAAVELGRTPHARFKRALSYSQEHQTDLASAYSVLLGIMAPEEAARLTSSELAEDWLNAERLSGEGLSGDPPPDERPPDERPPDERPPDERPPRERTTAPSYDPGFGKAISEGCLTVRQAVERGDRVRLASNIARKHKLSMHAAFDVADNRCTVRAALQSKQEKAIASPSSLRPEPPVGHAFPWAATLLGFVGVLALLGGLWFSGQWEQPVDPPAGPKPLTLQESRELLSAGNSTEP
jgi:hypothetical protein